MGDGGGHRRAALCDLCGEAVAVLDCRADAARLCLPCDALVHAANPLARQHTRAPLCHNCAAAAATALCAADGLALCSDCDWSAHGFSHFRNPVEAFSGCPTALELAAAWGLDLPVVKIPPFTPGDHELSHCDNNWTALDSIPAADPLLGNLYAPCAKCPKSSLSGGRGRQELLRQLVELAGREPVAVPVPSDLSPRTPSRNVGGQEEEEEEKGQAVEKMAFTSLLNLDSSASKDLKGNERLVEHEDLIWDRGPSEHVVQVQYSSSLLSI